MELSPPDIKRAGSDTSYTPAGGNKGNKDNDNVNYKGESSNLLFLIEIFR